MAAFMLINAEHLLPHLPGRIKGVYITKRQRWQRNGSASLHHLAALSGRRSARSGAKRRRKSRRKTRDGEK